MSSLAFISNENSPVFNHIFKIFLCISKSKKGHRRDDPTLKILTFLDSKAKIYPGILGDQNKYDTFYQNHIFIANFNKMYINLFHFA